MAFEQNMPDKYLQVIAIILNIILIIVYIKKAIKYIKKNKELTKFKPTTKLEYYRELPDEKATPGEVVKILNVNISSFTPTNFGKIFSATILDLTLKGYLEIKQEKNTKGKENINIYVLKQVSDGLRPSEERIMTFIRTAAGEDKVITLKGLQKYIENHSSKIESLIKATYNESNNELINQKVIDEKMQKEYESYKEKQTSYIVSGIAILFLSFIIFIIPVILFFINAII